MKQSAYARFSITLFLLVALLSPTAVFATEKEGKKRFTAGMKAEDTEQWDKAAEEFALAVVADPKNPEYRLHYQRALFNASQMYAKKGTAQLNEKDYAGAYLSFRKAYAYDPTNELAKGEMDKALRLQKGIDGDEPDDRKTDANDASVKLVPTSYRQSPMPQTQIPQRLEKLRDLPFPSGVDVEYIIRELAKDLDLNVLFDQESFRQTPPKVKIELKNVTSARALDYIFLQTGLFFQKVGPRTILIANQQQRTRFQQLVLRTFYLANADPTEVAKVVQFAIPPQNGRTPIQPLVDKPTNSITVRDTTENIRIIGNLIKSLDKDRAEVVMDVQIYEVNKSDLLQLGNQIGNKGSLANLGGTTTGTFGNNEFGNTVETTNTAGQIIRSIVPSVLGIGVVVPAINIVALQSKQNTKLIASTQIHAFNNEDSSARIGQRVPIQSAQLLGYGNNGNTGGNTNQGPNAASVITYEQVGLTLKFKPIVFPNQDVQVAMEIESKDVSNENSFTPLFTERTVKGTARVQNNKTLLLASVAQNTQSNGREGLPLLGLIPILGRLFTAPTKNNRQVDIVIAVTPRVIRAPTILPEDETERPTGSLATPTSGSLEALIVQEEVEEQLAMARRMPTTATVQLPDQKADAPTYTKTTSQAAPQNPAATPEIVSNDAATAKIETGVPNNSFINSLKPIDVSVKTLQIGQTSDTSGVNTVAVKQTSLIEDAPKTVAPFADLQILPTLSEMKAGEKVKFAVMIKSATAFRSAVLGMKFDQTKVAVRSVGYGDVFGAALAQTTTTPFINQNGKMYVTLASPKDIAESSSGILAYIEIEALTDGKPNISFDADMVSMLTADGKSFAVKF